MTDFCCAAGTRRPLPPTAQGPTHGPVRVRGPGTAAVWLRAARTACVGMAQPRRCDRCPFLFGMPRSSAKPRTSHCSQGHRLPPQGGRGGSRSRTGRTHVVPRPTGRNKPRQWCDTSHVPMTATPGKVAPRAPISFQRPRPGAERGALHVYLKPITIFFYLKAVPGPYAGRTKSSQVVPCISEWNKPCVALA